MVGAGEEFSGQIQVLCLGRGLLSLYLVLQVRRFNPFINGRSSSAYSEALRLFVSL